jgi:hypothetical protein
MLPSWFDMKRKQVSALTLKTGPSESGVEVGGKIIPLDTLSTVLSRFWFLLILLLPLVLLLYKRRSSIAGKFLKLLRLT